MTKPTITNLTEQMEYEFNNACKILYFHPENTQEWSEVPSPDKVKQFFQTQFRIMAEQLLGNADELAERIVIEYANITGREEQQRPFVREAARTVLESVIKEAKK